MVDRHGFEVGVHDLNHDGRLFSSQESFRPQGSTDQPLPERMERRWLSIRLTCCETLSGSSDLNIAYDACTFDTDPFEPQPDGVNTIFPILGSSEVRGLQAPSSELRPQSQLSTLNLLTIRCGYVELPYTLPQDSTLFLYAARKDNRDLEEKTRLDRCEWRDGSCQCSS